MPNKVQETLRNRSSMGRNEMMYHSTKSEAEGIPQDVTEVHAEYDCLIQDGGQLIHVLDPRGAATVL